MSKFTIPENYKSRLDVIETEVAIKNIKDYFERELAIALKLTRVSAPLFVRTNSGLNDNLNGVEKPVSFKLKNDNDAQIEIVHSLAKWKRLALEKYGFKAPNGIYTDMNAIRADEEFDNTHSIYVDQWDWEKVITAEDRTLDYLKSIVEDIYEVFLKTEDFIYSIYSEYDKFLPKEIFFITSQELEDRYPSLTPDERENELAKEKGAIFIMQIGKTLLSGEKHDGRAPDYDDWELNGDLILWNPVLGRALELSSMGIRVDSESLKRQLALSGCEDRLELEYHRLLSEDKLPLTIGGGIGQSRICMFFLQKAHIGEVQASVWPKEMIEVCESSNIHLL